MGRIARRVMRRRAKRHRVRRCVWRKRRRDEEAARRVAAAFVEASSSSSRAAASSSGSEGEAEDAEAANTWQWLLRRKAESRRRLAHIARTWAVDGAEAHVMGLGATRVRVERRAGQPEEPWSPACHGTCCRETRAAAVAFVLCRNRGRALGTLPAEVVARVLGYLPSGRLRVVTTRRVNAAFEWTDVDCAPARHVAAEDLAPVYPVEGDLIRVALRRGRVADARLWAISEFDNSAAIHVLPERAQASLDDDRAGDHRADNVGDRVDYHFPLERILAKSATRRDEDDDDDFGENHDAPDDFSMSDFDASDDFGSDSDSAFASDSDDFFTDPDDY